MLIALLHQMTGTKMEEDSNISIQYISCRVCSSCVVLLFKINQVKRLVSGFYFLVTHYQSWNKKHQLLREALIFVL